MTTPVDIGAVQPSDHPDFVGGVVWSPVELRWINERLSAMRDELHQYRLSPQLGCSVDAEVWHQLRMKMDAALGPDFDPYVRGECFAALDAIVKQRDEARAALTASEKLLGDTNEALAACQAQAAGRIRELETRLAAARYDDELTGDDEHDNDSGHCECAALHSDGTEEMDSGVCSACGGLI